MIGNLVWCLVDPVLKRAQSRLEHLARHSGRAQRSRQWAAVAELGQGVAMYPEALIQNAGGRESITIGDFSYVRGEIVTLTPTARIEIGHHSFVGPGSRIWAQTRIRIGNHVLISHLVDIHDTNAHAVQVDPRREDGLNRFERNAPVDWSKVHSAPVTIEDDVWIGFKSSIFKGVTLGRGAVVAACSVVTKDVPPLTLVAGNPARVVRDISQDE